MRVVKLIIPSDKSISHRAIMLASIAEGTTCIKNLLMAEDIKRTIEAFQAMGVRILFERSSEPTTGTQSRSPQRFSTALTECALNSARTVLVGSEDRSKNIIKVCGVGMRGLKKPKGPLYLGNSGTTMRLLPGILAGQNFEVILTGDASLSKRPMQRIIEPLRKMGAIVVGRERVLDCAPRQGSEDRSNNIGIETNSIGIEAYPPIKIKGGKLKAIKYKSKIASAQVKSCLLLAGLFADGTTSVNEPVKSRDHTEKMLGQFGCNCQTEFFSTPPHHTVRGRSKNIVRVRPTSSRGKAESRTISVKGPVKLKSPGVIEIPGDISSAANFVVAGCVLPDIKVVIKDVGLNPTRTGIIDILRKMGGDIKCKVQNAKRKTYEIAGDVIVRSSKLKGIAILPEDVVRAIDEIPIIMVAACFAKGKTVIKGIEELKVKETDRVKSMITNLQKLGADIDLCFSTRGVYPERSRGTRSKNIVRARHRRCRVENEEKSKPFIVINGGKKLHGAKVESFGDHRTAMSMMAVGVLAGVRVRVRDTACINKSFPGFEKLLSKL